MWHVSLVYMHAHRKTHSGPLLFQQRCEFGLVVLFDGVGDVFVLGCVAS